MKIASLNAYQENVSRGAETFVQELSKRLSQKNTVEVISGDSYHESNWPVIWRVFLDPKGLQILFFTLKKLSYLWKNKFDVVIPINGGWQPALLRILTWLYGGKMIIAGQSGIGWDDKNNLWCFPDYFVALSSYAKTWAKKINPFVATIYIPNGVDIKNFSPEGSKMKLKLKKPIIITVGALTQTKRINLTIEAVSRLRNVSLLVVGDGELRKDLEDLGQLLLPDRFAILKLPFEEMPKAYRCGNLFTLVSEPFYSFEIAIIEALSTNLPVVVNNDPLRKEIVGDAGIFVNPEDSESYAKALERALRTDWENKPRKQAEKFSWDKVALQYEVLFKSLILK